LAQCLDFDAKRQHRLGLACGLWRGLARHMHCGVGLSYVIANDCALRDSLAISQKVRSCLKFLRGWLRRRVVRALETAARSGTRPGFFSSPRRVGGFA
jgi:hypothetical protein